MVNVPIPLGQTDYSRSVAQIPDIAVFNRFFERDPTNQDDQVALLSRPCLRKWIDLGTSPVRGVYSQPGTFAESLFAVGGNTLYKIAQNETKTTVGTLGSSTGSVSMAATDAYLFVADGSSLKYYTESDFARGTLTASGAISAGEKVVVGSVTYQFASDVTTGTPDGTSANPWMVSLGGSTAQALQHLFDAINGSGIAGTDYNSTLYANTAAVAVSNDATTLVVRAFLNGTDGNSIATTETGTNLAWGGATLSGGGGTTFASIAVPDGDGIVSVGVIGGYCICVVAQGFGKNGRFYWIEPGEIIIDPLNFATAEKAPDPVWEVVVSGDKFWLPGSSSIEVWYLAGQQFAPFLRQQGVLFEQGIWEGTILALKETMLCVGNDGMPYIVTDRPNPIGSPGVAQRLREAINATRAA